MLDSLYWNATLRLDLIARDAKPTVETDLVCCQGLVALSLNGNYITDIGMGFVRRAIKSNHWLLGEDILAYCFYFIYLMLSITIVIIASVTLLIAVPVRFCCHDCLYCCMRVSDN